MVEKAIEVGNAKATYMFCMLELLRGSKLKSDDLEWVFKLLGSLKENEDMVWLRDHIAWQFVCECGDSLGTVCDWLGCHGKCQLTEV